MATMKAAIYRDVGKIEVCEVPLEEPAPGVVVEVAGGRARMAVCRGRGRDRRAGKREAPAPPKARDPGSKP